MAQPCNCVEISDASASSWLQLRPPAHSLSWLPMPEKGIMCMLAGSTGWIEDGWPLEVGALDQGFIGCLAGTRGSDQGRKCALLMRKHAPPCMVSTGVSQLPADPSPRQPEGASSLDACGRCVQSGVRAALVHASRLSRGFPGLQKHGLVAWW